MVEALRTFPKRLAGLANFQFDRFGWDREVLKPDEDPNYGPMIWLSLQIQRAGQRAGLRGTGL